MSSAGSDDNDGPSAGQALATMQKAGSKLADGTYTISDGNCALNLGGGAIEGSADRSSVVIDATGTSGADLQNGSITNATITATATANGPERYALVPMKNASLTTTQTWFYINTGANSLSTTPISTSTRPRPHPPTVRPSPSATTRSSRTSPRSRPLAVASLSRTARNRST